MSPIPTPSRSLEFIGNAYQKDYLYPYEIEDDRIIEKKLRDN